MSAKYPEPILVKLGAGKRWALAAPYELPLEHCTLLIPQGFTFDLASVPRPFLPVIDDDECSTLAPLVHDALYAHRGELPIEWCAPYRLFSRRESDRLFRELMLAQGVPRWRAWVAWAAVRIGTPKSRKGWRE